MKSQSLLKNPWSVFWIISFVFMVVLGAFWPNSEITAFARLSGILLCLASAIVHFPHDYLLIAAMLTTCAADLFLASDNSSTTGVSIFVIVQLIHLWRLGSPKFRLPIIAYALTFTALMILNFEFKIIPQLFISATFYGIAIIANTINCFMLYRRDPKNQRIGFALLGFITFISCDFNVALSFLAKAGTLPAVIFAPTNFFVWLFYYPSQIFISNSGKCDIMIEKEGKC